MSMIFRMVRPSKDDNDVKNNKEYSLQYKFDDYQVKDSRFCVWRMGNLS